MTVGATTPYSRARLTDPEWRALRALPERVNLLSASGQPNGPFVATVACDHGDCRAEAGTPFRAATLAVELHAGRTHA